jgi:glycogen operon protein
MSPEDWSTDWVRSLAAHLPGGGLAECDERGCGQMDDSLLVILNGFHDPVEFAVPEAGDGQVWQVLVDTARIGGGAPELFEPVAAQRVALSGRSLMLLRAAPGKSGI